MSFLFILKQLEQSLKVKLAIVYCVISIILIACSLKEESPVSKENSTTKSVKNVKLEKPEFAWLPDLADQYSLEFWNEVEKRIRQGSLTEVEAEIVKVKHTGMDYLSFDGGGSSKFLVCSLKLKSAYGYSDSLPLKISVIGNYKTQTELWKVGKRVKFSIPKRMLDYYYSKTNKKIGNKQSINSTDLKNIVWL